MIHGLAQHGDYNREVHPAQIEAICSTSLGNFISSAGGFLSNVCLRTCCQGISLIAGDFPADH